MLKYIIFLIICFYVAVSSLSSLPKKEKVVLEPTLENLLFSLEKLMLFFSKRYEKINLDGLFGVRAVQGEIRRILEKIEEGDYPPVKDEVKDKLWSILSLADDMVPRALPVIKKNNEEYYENFKPIIEKPYRTFEVKPEKITTYDPDALPKTQTQENDIGFDESMSDDCMGSLIGTHGHSKCDVDVCWDKMTVLNTSLYYTTHQILWLQLGIDAGCQANIEAKVVRGGGLVELFRKLCTSIIFQMESLHKNDKVHLQFQDIFLEQGMVCGGMGFMSAVNRTWLKTAMTWQNQKLGCFKDYDSEAYGDYNEFYDDLAEKRKEWRSRYLLMDAHMGNLCSAHKTAVAAGFYAVYLRLFLDPAYIENMLWPELYGPGYATKQLRLRQLKYFGIFIFVIVLLLLIFRPRLRYKLCSKVREFRRKKVTSL